MAHVTSLCLYGMTIIIVCSYLVRVETKVCLTPKVTFRSISQVVPVPHVVAFTKTNFCLHKKCERPKVVYKNVVVNKQKPFMEYVKQCCAGYMKMAENPIIQNVPQAIPVRHVVAFPKNGFCLFNKCKRPGVVNRNFVVNRQKPYVLQVNECCEGYMKVEEKPLTCHPICNPPCINGYCQTPGVCACNANYTNNPVSPHTCLPICSDQCSNGRCVAPNSCECDNGYQLVGKKCEPICTIACENGICIPPDTCKCNGGYQLVGNKCEPICTIACENGICVAPDTCQCNNGYQLVGKKCEPICTTACENGICVAPDTCQCNNGYQLVGKKCEPKCTIACQNGICIAPDTCQCNDGYEYVFMRCMPVCTTACQNGFCVAPDTCLCANGFYLKDNTCHPICSSECVHGTCVAPERCQCNDGWEMSDGNECSPKCDRPCGNGTCTAPNVCNCFHGYELDIRNIGDRTKSMCVPKCNNCNGSCIAPFKCVCEGNDQPFHTNANGGSCDCFENCMENSTMCVRTTCHPLNENNIEMNPDIDIRFSDE